MRVQLARDLLKDFPWLSCLTGDGYLSLAKAFRDGSVSKVDNNLWHRTTAYSEYLFRMRNGESWRSMQATGMAYRHYQLVSKGVFKEKDAEGRKIYRISHRNILIHSDPDWWNMTS